MPPGWTAKASRPSTSPADCLATANRLSAVFDWPYARHLSYGRSWKCGSSACSGLMWWALEHSYRAGRLHEELIIDSEEVHLTRTGPKGDVQTWDCNCHWAQAQIYPSGGPVAHYVTLRGAGREVELGAFLSEDERKALYGELRGALGRACARR